MRPTAATTAGRVQALAPFAVVASLGPAFVLWTQAMMYGHPLEPGYPGWEAFYRIAHVPANVRQLPALPVRGSHAARAARARNAAPAARTGRDRPARRQPRSLVQRWHVTLLTFALYLPYLPFDDPHVAAVHAAGRHGAVRPARRWNRRRRPRAVSGDARWLTPVALVPALLVAVTPASLFEFVRTYGDGQRRVVLMGRYLQQALPPNAVVLAYPAERRHRALHRGADRASRSARREDA